MSIQLENENEVTVVTLYIQHETINEFWDVYKSKDDAINGVKAFMEESNEISFMEDPEFDREVWELIKDEDTYQVWQEKNFGHQKEFHFHRKSL